MTRLTLAAAIAALLLLAMALGALFHWLWSRMAATPDARLGALMAQMHSAEAAAAAAQAQVRNAEAAAAAACAERDAALRACEDARRETDHWRAACAALGERKPEG